MARPNVASAFRHLLGCDVLLLAIDEGPNLIALNAAHAKIAHIGIVEGSTGTAKVFQKFQDGVLRNSGHPTGGVNRHALHQARDYLGLAISFQAIHKGLMLHR